MQKVKVGVLVGSLRKGSYSRSVANALIADLPANFEAEVLEIGNLPLYNEDIDVEGSVPAAYTAFREQVAQKDAFIFVSPEYNRSTTGALKNALDVGSRPYGKNLWGGKPAAIVGVTPGKTGAFGANHHLRQIATVLDIYTMQQPEAYIGDVHTQIDENGKVADSLAGFIKVLADGFAAWTGKFIG